MKAQYDLSQFQELLQRHISPDDLAKMLDEAMINYAVLTLSDNDSCGSRPDVCNHIYWLRTLRDMLHQLQ